MKAKAILDFIFFSDANLETKASFIFSSMNGNPYFPNPTVPLPELDTAYKDFVAAIAGAKTKDSGKIALKNEKRKTLEDTLRELARYVNFIANGNRVILISSGFTVSAETKNTVTLGEVNNFSVVTGQHSGEATLSLDPVDGRKTYLFLYAEAPVVNDSWQHAVDTVPYITIKNLKPMTQYCFCICISGSKGQKVYTEIITKGVV